MPLSKWDREGEGGRKDKLTLKMLGKSHKETLCLLKNNYIIYKYICIYSNTHMCVYIFLNEVIKFEAIILPLRAID